MAKHKNIPLIVLAGRTPESGRLPEGVVGQQSLSGCKGAELRYGGRTQIEHLLERMRAPGVFDPVVVAGPAAVYEPLGLDATLLDTDGSFGINISHAVESVHRDYPDSPLAIVTCDVLPEPQELADALEDYFTGRPADLWFPLIRAGDGSKLNSSGWKPRYSVTPAPGEPAEQILPCHLMIVWPEALRRRFIYRLFDAAYDTRNRPVLWRTGMLFWRLAGVLTREDFGAVLAGSLPRLWLRALIDGIGAGRALARGGVAVSELERAADNLLIRPEWRREHPGRGVRAPLLDALSFARDIDTQEEAMEFAQRVAADHNGSG